MGGSAAARFPAALVRKLSESLRPDAAAESAVPSYTHRIPMIRWLMFRRLDMIERMALAELPRNATRAGHSALDFGCGIGMMIPFHAANVVFLPPEELATRIDDARLNVVIAADVLEHVDDLATVVGTLRRKMRVGGALIVSGPTESRAYRWGRKIAGFTGEYHVRSVFEVEEGIRAGGLVRERVLRLPFPFAPVLFRITRWRRAGA